jgi:hypothetical protein
MDKGNAIDAVQSGNVMAVRTGQAVSVDMDFRDETQPVGTGISSFYSVYITDRSAQAAGWSGYTADY